MRHRPPGTLGVLRLLAATSLRRLVRAAAIRRQKRAAKTGRRGATSRKRGDGLAWLLLLMTPIFLFQGVMISGQAVGRLQTAAAMAAPGGEVMVLPGILYRLLCIGELTEPSLVATLDGFGIDEDSDPPRARILSHWRDHGRDGFRGAPELTDLLAEPKEWLAGDAARIFAGCAALLLLALGGVLLAIGFGGANTSLAGDEWTQAWLLTFPVTTRSIVLAKALEYSLVTFFPWLVLCPLVWQLLRAQGQPAALPVAIGATLATTFLIGAARLWLETRLRLTCSLHTLRSVQGGCTLLALLLMALVFVVCLGPAVPDWFVDVGAAVPAWLQLAPVAWPAAIPTYGPIAALVGVAATAAVLTFAVAGTTRRLGHGAMRSAGVDAGARGTAGGWRRGRRLGVVGKDLALLLRDRNFLVQTIAVPVFVIGLQLLVNPGFGEIGGAGIALLAYGIGLYSLIGGCFQVLSAEGRALWLLYSLPVSIAEALRRKTRIWAVLAVAFGEAALFAFALRGGAAVDVGELVVDALFVAVGIWCAAHIAAGVSVIGCNPTADHVPRQPKARHVYLYFFFASTFFVGLAAPGLALRCAAALVFATLAYAVWQRACDRLPWLLDPVDEPRVEVGLLDGAAAVIVYFVLQALFAFLLVGRPEDGRIPALGQAAALLLAGAATCLLYLAILSSRGVDVGAALGLRFPGGRRALSAVAIAIGAGAALGALGLGYVHLVERQGWFELPVVDARDQFAFVGLAVCIAPLVEEVLFRGLVFGGLARSVRPAVAVLWSAALFAAVHPVHAFAPVFLLGVLAAVLQLRTRFLPAAILLHASYNFVVVTWS